MKKIFELKEEVEAGFASLKYCFFVCMYCSLDQLATINNINFVSTFSDFSKGIYNEKTVVLIKSNQENRKQRFKISNEVFFVSFVMIE